MKAALYSPYLDTFGGGEKYIMTIAEILSSNDYQVNVLLNDNLYRLGAVYLKTELSKRFDIDLENVNFIRAPMGKNSNFLKRLFFLNNYDLFIYLSDGSIFFPTAKKNILHLQSPLRGEAQSLWRRLKLSYWNRIIYNSEFTKKNAEDYWPIASEVIYPPVDVDKIQSLTKKKNILSVGRFSGYLKDKKHEFLIEVFKELYNGNKINGWSLHLVGSLGEGDRDYLQELKKLASTLPIRFYPNLEYDTLIRLYGESSIYWHAAGFGEEDPNKMEHFGISTVEAMAGGCIPVVIAKGGQVEIVENGVSGFLWNQVSELKRITIKVTSNSELRVKMSSQAIKRARVFDKKIFIKKIRRLISNI